MVCSIVSFGTTLLSMNNTANFEKPRTWSEMARASYHNRKWAMNTKPMLDALLNDPSMDVVVSLRTMGVKASTIKARISQACLWLSEQKDGAVYAELWSNIRFRKEGMNVRITCRDMSKNMSMPFEQVPQVSLELHKDVKLAINLRSTKLLEITSWIGAVKDSKMNDQIFDGKGPYGRVELEQVKEIIDVHDNIHMLDCSAQHVYLVKRDDIDL